MQNPDPQDIRRASRIFKALSHPDRLRIACRLSEGPAATQKALIDHFGWPQSTMARHIATLREHGLIVTSRVGGEVQLRIAGPMVTAFLDAMCHWVHPETGETLTTAGAAAAWVGSADELVGAVSPVHQTQGSTS